MFMFLFVGISADAYCLAWRSRGYLYFHRQAALFFDVEVFQLIDQASTLHCKFPLHL